MSPGFPGSQGLPVPPGSPLPLDAGWVGHRVVIRHALAGGGLSDALGMLEALSDSTVVVRRRDGSAVEVDRAAVRIAKLVPPAPTPRLRTTPENLEAAAAVSWPAPEQERLGGWTLRAADGFSRRANSALPLGDPGLPLVDALARVEGFYGARGLPPLVQVVVGSAWDDELAAHGWVDLDDGDGVHVQVASVSGLLDRIGTPEERGVVISDHLVDGWFELYRSVAASDAARAVLERPYGDVALAHVDEPAGTPIAVGRGALSGPWLAVSALTVDEAHRRSGLGRAVVAALAGWGWSRGARWVHLKVDDDNIAARRLYTELGFTTHHRVLWRGPHAQPHPSPH